MERENPCDSIEREENSGRNDYSCIDVRGWIYCTGEVIDLPKHKKFILNSNRKTYHMIQMLQGCIWEIVNVLF